MKKQMGFTLVELMIAVAIIGVLTAVSIISYQNYMSKTERNRDCVMQLPEMAVDMEKYKRINAQYPATDNFTQLNTVSRVGMTWAATPADTSNTHTYAITATETTFTLTCTPTKVDAAGLDASGCGALTYDNFGRKGGVGASGTPLVFPASSKPVEICWR